MATGIFSPTLPSVGAAGGLVAVGAAVGWVDGGWGGGCVGSRRLGQQWGGLITNLGQRLAGLVAVGPAVWQVDGFGAALGTDDAATPPASCGDTTAFPTPSVIGVASTCTSSRNHDASQHFSQPLYCNASTAGGAAVGGIGGGVGGGIGGVGGGMGGVNGGAMGYGGQVGPA